MGGVVSKYKDFTRADWMKNVHKKEVFRESGPNHLIRVDWINQHHVIAVLACLVRAVYILELDRQKKRTGTPESQAEPWYQFFHFSLVTLMHDSDGSITAAIFEYDDKNTHYSGIPPRFVTAIRGTMLKRATWVNDVLLDARLCYTNPHGERYRKIMKEIESVVSTHGNTGVWLAGHSLGAALALLVGKTMARSGYPLETHLFNPPTALICLKVLRSKRLKFVVRVTGNIIRNNIVKVTGHDKGEEDESSMNLKDWIPYLYVNLEDPVCSEYIDYFKDGQRMSEMIYTRPVSLGTRFTPVRLFASGRKRERGESSEPLHILHSAYLMTNTTISQNDHGVLKGIVDRVILRKRFKAHALNQWWVPKLNVKCELFKLSD